MKWITLIILVIATISLVFGGFVMLLGAQHGANNTQGATSEEMYTTQE